MVPIKDAKNITKVTPIGAPAIMHNAATAIETIELGEEYRLTPLRKPSKLFFPTNRNSMLETIIRHVIPRTSRVRKKFKAHIN